jgi:hypothetical protein
MILVLNKFDNEKGNYTMAPFEKSNKLKRNSKYCISNLLAAVVATLIFQFVAVTAVSAPFLNRHPSGYASISPSSIPVFESPGVGATDIGMVTLRFESTSPTGRVASIRVQLTTDGSFDETDVDKIKVYWDDGDNIFETNGDDDDVTAAGTFDFSGGNPDWVDLDVNHASNSFSAGWERIYITFDFKSTADISANISTTLGCEILQVLYGQTSPNYNEETYTEPTTHGNREDFDDYEATLTATGIAPTPAEGQQGELRVPTLKLEFFATDSTLNSTQYSKIDSIRVQRVGTGADSDVTSAGVILYDDSGSTAGSFDSGDAEVLGSAASLVGGYANLNPTADLPITTTGTTYFVAINIDASAVVGKTIGLRVEDPSNDVVFKDDLPTDIYTQMGFIISSTSTPASGNTVTITELPLVDTTPPTVSFTDPADTEKNVSVNTDITVVFSEEINPATISTANFTVKDIFNNTVSGTVSASGSSATFTPSSVLSFETIFNVTVAAGVQDLAGNPLAADYTWSFTTIEDVPEPVAANNRILPGQTDPVKIYIPVPPGGQSEKVTVQIFTVTGEKVVTLVKNRPYSQIAGSLPLEWFGKNSKQKNLGPGLYFIQIKTSSYTKVLKVLIVR